MGKGKKSQNEEEVLGQIFDFIFKEAKKDPSKRRPIKLKPTGISTSQELVDGLATALAQPGVYVTDQILDSMNRALTVEFGSLSANESGTQKAKITTTNLVQFLSDPNKFLSKPKAAARMGIKDAMKASFLGRVQEELVSNAWAKRYNLDLDAQKAIRGHYEAERFGREAEAGRAFATAAGAVIGGDDTSRKNYVVGRSIDLVGKEMFGRNGWEAMSDARKAELQKALQGGNSAVKKYIYATYGDPTVPGAAPRARLGGLALSRYDALRTDMGLRKIDPTNKLNNRDDSFDLFDVKQYNGLEVRNLEGRIKEMQLYIARNPGLSINERQRIEMGIEKLEQASVIVTGSHLGLDKVQGARVQLKSMLGDYKTRLEAAKRAGNKDGIRFYQNEIRNLKRGNRQLSLLNFWGKVGQAEGTLDSLKGVLGEGFAPNAISSILDGSFYDKGKNSFALPCDSVGVSLGSHAWSLTDENGVTDKKPRAEEIKILVATRKVNGVEVSKMRYAYNSLMTNIYYLTPASVMKTLFVNGEGFVYLAHQRATSAMEILKDQIDFDKLMKSDPTYMAFLKSKGINAGGLKFSRNLAKIFSFGQRKRDMVKDWVDSHIFKKIRQKIYNSLIKRITDKEALALLGKWLAKGGFEVVAKALVIGLLDALGIAATGGLGAFLVPILSSILVDVFYGAAKFLIQLLLIMLLGVVGLWIFGFSSAKKAFDAQTYAYTNVVPGEVVTNPNFTGTSPITGEDDPAHNIGDFVGGTLPDGEKCLIGSGSFYCSQGPFSVGATSDIHPSHENVAAIDVVGVNYFYAPTFCGDNNCKVTYAGEVRCTAGSAGGMMIFTATYGGNTYEFKLIHVQPGFGVGATLSSGQRVARVMTHEETTSACSSGMHIHIQTKMNGKVVDPQDVLEKSTSSGGFSCDIGECPHIIN